MADGVPLYELQIRDWEQTDSFVTALMKNVEPTSTEYISQLVAALAGSMAYTAPYKTGELSRSIHSEVLSPTRGMVLMVYYGVWVDRGHRVVMRTRNRYRVRADLTRNWEMKSSRWLARSKAANFIRAAINSPIFQKARMDVYLAFRRRQSN